MPYFTAILSLLFTAAVLSGIPGMIHANRNGSKINGPKRTTASGKEELKIGLIIPYTFECDPLCFERVPVRGEQYAAAFKIAVDQINRNPTLLPHHKITFVYNNTKLDEKLAVKQMYWQVNSMKVSALVGLGWHCFPLATIATALNIPAISQGCKEEALIMRHSNLLFTRTYPLTVQLVPSVYAILKKFNWNKIALITNRELDSFQMTGNERISHQLTEYGINIAYQTSVPESFNIYNPDREAFKDIMLKIKTKATVVVFLCSYDVAREALVSANRVGMTNGKFAFILVTMSPEVFNARIKHPIKWFFSSYQEKVSTAPEVQEAFKTALLLGPTIESTPEVKQFIHQLQNKSSQAPFYSHYYVGSKAETIPALAYYLYDSVLVYALAINRTLEKKQDIRDGKTVYDNMKGISYKSSLGYDMTVDELGNKGMYVKFHYKLYTAVKNKSSFVMKYTADFVPGNNVDENSNKTDLLYKEISSVTWPWGVPKEVPCDYSNTCRKKKDDFIKPLSISICVSVIVVVLILVPLFKYRNYRLERSLTNKLWEIDIEELHILEGSLYAATSLSSLGGEIRAPLSPCDNQSEVRTVGATYKSAYVAVKIIEGHSVELKRATLLEMKQIRELRHDNINPFIGAHIKTNRVLIVTQFASRGSLEDVLEDNTIKLDTFFRLSLIYDIIKGMSYLHTTDIVSHGNLKSSNCVIDNRWVLKITDFGLNTLKGKRTALQYNKILDTRSLLWCAPEILRDQSAPLRGTQKGDVYSFAIILQECHTRRGPWSDNDLSIEDIIAQVQEEKSPPLRPIVDSTIINAVALKTMMERCWSEDPADRPTFFDLRKDILSVLKANGIQPNMMENMMHLMEEFAAQLKGLVGERNKQLSIEKRKIESLLERMLPPTVSKQLKQGKEVEAEDFDEVSIYFSDIAGFTSLCAESTPLQVVTFLNQLYTLFDNIIRYYDVYKVETIGDAYMVVSGLPIRNGKEHAKEICLMALHITKSISSFVIHHKKDRRLSIRIGIHTGHVVAGVVGTTMPRYCLFGDTVNTASRMESTGEALKIQLSQSTKEILDTIGGFHTEERGPVAVKGKGVVTTYWLLDVDAHWSSLISKHEKSLAELSVKETKHEVFKNSPNVRIRTRPNKLSPQGTPCNSTNVSPSLIRKSSRYKNRKDLAQGTVDFNLRESARLLRQMDSIDSTVHDEEIRPINT